MNYDPYQLLNITVSKAIVHFPILKAIPGIQGLKYACKSSPYQPKFQFGKC